MVPLCFALRPRVFHWDPVFSTETPCFPPDPVFFTRPRVFHTPGPRTPGPRPRVFHLAILAAVMLFSRVTGVLPNTGHRSQISELISQLGKGLWGLKHGLSRNRYAIYLIRQQAVLKRAIAHRHPARPEKEKHLEHCTEEIASFCHKWRQNTTKGLKGVEASLKVLSKKAVHGRIPKDFAKPSLVSRIYPNSRTIHSTAMENTLTSTRN